MAKISFLFFAISASLTSPAMCQVLERILSADEKDRVGLIVNELSANARLTADKVLDVKWSYSGKFAESTATDGEGLGAGHKPRTSGKLHFVMGQNRFWGMQDSPQLNFAYDAYQYTADSQTSRTYSLRDGKIVAVDLWCDYHSLPEPDLDIYSDLFHCPPWRNGNVRATPERFQALLASSKWAGASYTENGKPYEISIKRKRQISSSHARASSEVLYRFRESNGQLLFVGRLSRSNSPQTFGSEEYDAIDELIVDVKYAVIGGFQLPSEVRHRVTMRTVNPDGTPYKHYKPAEIRHVTWRLEKSRVIDQFPNELLNVSVPSSARITDHCRNQEERDVRRGLTESKWTRMHWLAVGGVLCCVGFGLWRYSRSRR